MNNEKSNEISAFEEREKKILEFEDVFTKNEQLANKCQDLEQKLKALEEKSSQDEVVAAQLGELHSKIEEYEKTIQDLNGMSSNLRNALANVQEDNIKLEDELNSLKTEHGDVGELKSKLKTLEETVISQQKELIEKDKILKGEFIAEEGQTSDSALQRFIVGKVETIKEFNNLIEEVKFRLFLIVPTIEDLEQLNLEIDEKVDIRIATSFDHTNSSHKKIIETVPNAEFRNYKGKDRWGIECDGEEVVLVALSENKDYIGISSADSKICDLFSKLLTEAWLKGEKIPL